MIDPESSKIHVVSVPQIVTIDKNGKPAYQFVLAHESKHKDKVVQLLPTSESEEAQAENIAATQNDEIVDGFVKFDGKYYKEYRPFDISITKNVLALFIAAAIVTWMVMALVRFYARKGFKAPRKGMGFLELCIDFIYTGVIKSTLGDKAPKFAPYLLTAFFFILVMNLLGLIVIFPGGANLTGNIAITLVLAVMTFVVTNINGNKHYWKEIFWPDVPLFLKFPLPIMQVIEVFGIFTKPAALCIRLFANMMGGHMIVITLTLLIFIFAAYGAAVAGGTAVISILFSIFMLLLDTLVSFIQAYVFTLLSTIFISMAIHEEHEPHAHEAHESAEATAPAKA
ncbi:MAG: F0F1 ATP synthase subunit A [Muribaculaceae bacterium]|nr:F0F1 ATP synthase subunit A [Muribaculaceae bacterium]